MKLENVLYTLFLVPLLCFAIWMGVSTTKHFYDWFVWYSSGAEILVVEGVLEAATPPKRKGPNQHKIVLKKDSGEKVVLRSKIPKGLYQVIKEDVQNRRKIRYTANYTVGLSGDNEMFKLTIGNNVIFRKAINFGNKPEQIIASIFMSLMWFGLGAIFMRMIGKEVTNKEKT